MPTSKVIRPAVFDETGEHVIPADADLNLDPVSSDPDNYIVRGSDGGAFLNGDGVLSNDGENLLKTSPNDGKVTYPRSDAVSLITETVQPFLDTIDGEAASAQIAADKAQAAADKAQASADQAKEDAAAAQCTATQALNDAADAQTAADKAQARADAAYDKASDAQCAADFALAKAEEAVGSLPAIADAHATIVTAGDAIKVAQSKLGDHNVYQVGVKANGDDSGLISSSDGLEVELKGNGGLDKDRDGLYVDQQWLNEIVARYSKEHMLFNQFKIVKQLPEIADADIHTIYLIRNKDSSAADATAKDSFNGWFIATTENGTQKWEEVGYKTDLTGYTHVGNTVKLTGDATGTGAVDANGSVVVPTAVSHAARADRAANADHAADSDHADEADHATNAGHATSADSATSAGSTTRATNADHADEADHATSAGSATRAANADHATSADHATNADSATKASSADRAANADHATSADSATRADSATNADHATNAANADHATKADSATKAASANKASEADHAADSDHADQADHAKVADKLAGGAGGVLGGPQWYDAHISPSATTDVSTVRVAYFPCGNGLYYFTCDAALNIPFVAGIGKFIVSLPGGFKHPYAKITDGKSEIAYSTSVYTMPLVNDSGASGGGGEGAALFSGFEVILACEVDNA